MCKEKKSKNRVSFYGFRVAQKVLHQQPFSANCYIWALLKGSFVVAEQLIALISAAKQHDIEFIYAISPGLDMTFSNPKEVATLKKKLDQAGHPSSPNATPNLFFLIRQRVLTGKTFFLTHSKVVLPIKVGQQSL